MRLDAFELKLECQIRPWTQLRCLFETATLQLTFYEIECAAKALKMFQ